MQNPNEITLFSGAATGAETYFGEMAEEFGVNETNFSYHGHEDKRQRGILKLNEEMLKKGDISITYASKLMNRNYPKTPTFRKILQTIWHMINNGEQIFVVGKILDDKTVKGGTGWGAEFAKLTHKELYVFDQEQNKWFRWYQDEWKEYTDPTITAKGFSGMGTRVLKENGKSAIRELYTRSFNKK